MRMADRRNDVHRVCLLTSFVWLKQHSFDVMPDPSGAQQAIVCENKARQVEL